MPLSEAQKESGVFERTLLTPSIINKYMAADKNAVTAAEKAGLKVFLTPDVIIARMRRYWRRDHAEVWPGNRLLYAYKKQNERWVAKKITK